MRIHSGEETDHGHPQQSRPDAVGPIWDPIAVRLCFDADLGATFPLRFGGKIGPASGTPIDAMVKVTGLARECRQRFGPTQVALAIAPA